MSMGPIYSLARGDKKQESTGCLLGREYFPVSLIGKVNEPATVEVIHKADGEPAISAEVTLPCLAPSARAGHSIMHSPLARTCWGLRLCTRLAHTLAQRANPEVFYPRYVCLRKFKSKFGPWL